MKSLNFVQFRMASGRISDIFEREIEFQSILGNTSFVEALREANPIFFETLNPSEVSVAQEKTLYKYFSRWCTRSTPFGKFSGVFSADLTDKTHFNELIPRFYTEPDVLEKRKLVKHLSQTQLNKARFYVNTSLHAFPEKYYLLQYTDNKYKQISLERFETLDAIVDSAYNGVSYSDLIRLIEECGFDSNDAAEFISELSDEQVLTTSYHFLQSETLEEFQSRHKNRTAKHNETYTFTVYPDAELESHIIQEIVSDVNQLGKLFTLVPNKRIEAFREEFLGRFEGQEIPLLQVLDSENGITYGSYSLKTQGDILNKLDSDQKKEPENEMIDGLLLDKYIDCLVSGRNEINFSEEDLKTDKKRKESVTFYVFGSLLKGDKFHLKHIGGSSAVNLMSRFSLGNDTLTGRLQEITTYEEAKTNAILAEVIHLPEGRIGNVVLHAPLREYYISYLGQDKGNEIPVSDLMVSVVGDEVVLRSVKHNKRIVPCLSHAHNYSTGLPLYCFLGDLQSSGAQFSFNWGGLKDREYLPRVTFKNLILARAEWNLTLKNFGALQNKLPRCIAIIEGDNELYLDLQQALCQRILNDHLRKNAVVKVQEFLQTSENCFIDGHVSEIVIPVAGDASKKAKPSASHLSEIKKSKKYPPGSQWLYFKIYTGVKTADKLLLDKIKPFVALLKQKEMIEKWFFIRYQDPDFHLRLRFYHGSNPDFYKTVVGFFYDHFNGELADGLIHDLQLATYKPEYSRYPDINEAESLFMNDSELILNRLESDEELYRLETSLKQIHSLLSGVSLIEKVSFCLNHRDDFLQEFGQNLKTELNKLYRPHSVFVKSILDIKSDFSIELQDRKALASYIHMHVNRNFIAEPRKYELVLYHFLYRYYESILARENLDLKTN